MTRPRVIVVDPVDPDAIDQLHLEYEVIISIRPEPGKLAALLADADAVIVRSGVQITAAIVEGAPRLRVVARAGAGTDNIDLAACKQAGVQVFNIPGASAGAVAELALGLVFAVTRNIAQADRRLRTGFWDKSGSAGLELQDRTLGVVGLGRIGSRLADLANAVGMRVLGSVAHPSPERDRALSARAITRVETNDLLSTADVICVTVPLNTDTHHLISDTEFDLMPSRAYLINVSRGDVIDDAALKRALQSGRIAGAGLDVHSTETGVPDLAAFDNVVLTPHIGATTTDAQRKVGAILVEQLRTALSGDSAVGRVV